MKKIALLLTALLTVAFVGCNKDPKPEGGDDDTPKVVTKTISATLPATKVALDGTAINWEAGDAISVFDGKSNNKFSMVEGSMNGSKANFSGEALDGASEYLVLYPYSATAKYADGKIAGRIASTQNPAAGDFDHSCYAAAGKVANDAVTLNSAVAFVKVTLGSSQNSKSLALVGNSGEAVAGDYSATVAADGSISAVTPDASAATTLVCNGDYKAGKSYLMTVFANTAFSKGITVTADLGEGNIATKAISGSVSIAPGAVYAVDMSDAQVAKISVSYVTPSDTLTFNLGETKEIGVTGVNVATIDFDPFGPTGWSTDASNSASGKVKITAPSTIEGIDPAANLVLLGTATSGSVASDTLVVRIAGINNKEDFVTFRDSLLLKKRGGLDPYLVDGWLTLNADITLTDEDMYLSASGHKIFLPVMDVPINGQNKTVTVNAVHDASAVSGTIYFGFIQWLKADVKDLNLAGSFELQNMPKKECRFGALAGVVGAQSGDTEFNVTVSNVKSSIDVKATNPVAGNSIRMSGFFGMTAGGSISNPVLTVKDCEYSGKMTTTENVRELAGFIGLSGSGTPGSIVNLVNCKFTGEIDYKQSANHGTLRISGIVGSAERTTTISKCESSGPINVDAGGEKLVSNTGGLAGICSRTNKQSGSNNMTYVITDCVNSSVITVTNAKTGDDVSSIAQILASPISTENLTLENNKENGDIKISYKE